MVVQLAKTRGRPTAAQRTVRFYKNGAARLSSDLVKAKDYEVSMDLLLQKIMLRPCRRNAKRRALSVWRTNSRAVSSMISLKSALEQMRVNWEDLVGKEFPASLIGNTVTIYLKGK